MNESDVKDWQDFETKIAELRQQHDRTGMLVFRGFGDSSWSLTTTLERYTGGVEMPFSNYYREIGTAQPQVETFTGSAGTSTRIRRSPRWRRNTISFTFICGAVS